MIQMIFGFSISTFYSQNLHFGSQIYILALKIYILALKIYILALKSYHEAPNFTLASKSWVQM